MKFSILTATYNRAKCLPKLYESLIKNISSNYEIEWLIMDDGSKDETENLIKDYIAKNEIEINRLYSGMNRDTIGTRKVKVRYPKQSLKLRVILDKYSVEIFVNDGSQVLSMTYYTPVEADEISFECNNTAVINIEKHGISVR